MADGLSVAASVIAVAQLAGACLKLSEKWIGPSEFSSSDLASLKTTLHGFFEAITKFETRLSALGNVQSRQGNVEYLPQVLERSKQALDMVQSFMNNRGFMGRHVIAPRFDGKLKAALRALDTAKELFLLAMHADNQEILLQVQQCLNHLAEDSRLFQDDTTNALKRWHEEAEERDIASKRFRQDSRMFQDTTTSCLKRLEENVSKMASIEPAQATEESPSLREAQKLKLMESLKFDQIDARHSTIKNAHARTCKWVLNNPEYNDWLDWDKISDHCGFIWIKGKPGAGKSTLMKFLLAQAKKKMKNSIIISFFFNARGGDLEKSTVGMYRSLLFQLLKERPELEDVLGSANMANFGGDSYEWSLEPLKALFEEAVHGLAQSSLMCFIDALDECDENEIRNMISFFESLGGQATSIKAQFRVCFSSRHYPHITIKRGLSLTLEGQEGHTQDLINYVETELKIGQSKLAQLIRTELREKAQGVFMWVVLVVEILNKEHDRGNIHKLRKRLQDIPGDLHALFRSILTRDDGNREKLLLCVQWVLFAREPLRPEQLHLAISCEFEPDILQEWDEDVFTPAVVQMSILDSSKGLIEITRSKIQTVQFIHESVKDFLLKNNGLQEIWPEIGCDLEGKSHERLKQCCLVQMEIDIDAALDLYGPLPTASSQDGKELRQSANRKFPFLEYSTRNVLQHANLAEVGGINQTDFLSDLKARRAKWIRLSNLFEQHEIRRYVEPVSLLYVFAELNLAALIQTQPQGQSCLTVEGSRYGLPLFAALATQSKDAATALLEAEAQAQPGNAPLQELARKFSGGEEGHMALVRSFKYSPKRCALSYAAEYGWAKILAFFLGSGQFDIDIESKAKKECTPLILAAEGGHRAVVELLIKNGANIEAKDDRGMTPLQHACWEGHEDVVEFLVSKGADLGTRDRNDRTPLISACEAGNVNVLKILLEKGAGIEEKDNNGKTSLICASFWGKEHCVEFLLERGAKIEAQDHRGDTPLIIASRGGKRGAVEILLEKGANIEAQNRDGETPLMCASRYDEQEVVEILLEKGANIEARDRQGRTALISASSSHYGPNNVRMLVERGANIEARDNTGCTALMLASANSNVGSVKILLERGANIEARDNTGCTALMLASANSSVGNVKILLERGANIEAKDNTGRTALMLASRDGRINNVELLLEKAANIEAKDNTGRTALMLASRNGHKSNVWLLLEKAANIEAKDNTGHTALMLASQIGDIHVVELLLEKGASIDMGNLSEYKPQYYRKSHESYELILSKAKQAGWTAS